MFIEVVKSKIHRVTVTEANLNYIGSITVDEDLLDAANLIANEKVANVNNNNGKIFVGAAFPTTVKEAKSLLFPEKEKNELRGGADGHVLAISDYEPGSEYVYYWGAAWDKADIKTPEAWNEYMANYAQKVRNPLTVTIK